MTKEAKTCLQCGKMLHGRADKKFCDDYCRNVHNNFQKVQANNYVRNINNALGKNRRILENLMPSDEDIYKTTKQKLLQTGFQFKYITHTYINKKGNTYFFCYEFGYLPLDNESFLIVRRREN